ncbi:DoxX family protein [Culturomica massiliensis]|uniref:DoxX family protein n=1 Tax=Culturomica massiliensis TaxID=1841857 RepID=UPI00266F8B8E|nr:DoxX family protein [Culturomica massiliensis]
MKSFFLYGTPLKGNGVSAFLFLLRLFVGIMMLTHGGVKLANFGSLMNTFPDPLGVTPMVSLLLSVSAEVGCSVLLIFGILTRLVTLPLIFNMLVAVFVIHGGDAFQAKELAVMYLAVYVFFFFIGGGRYSLDYRIFGKAAWKE